MASYGRNFDFRVPPNHGQRGGRYVIPTDAPAAIAIGAPVVWNTNPVDSSGRMPVQLATGAQAPVKGQSGLMVFEADPPGLQGFDPLLYTYSDIDVAQPGRAVQVVSGDAVKVAFRNTVDREFYNTRAYKGRLMVAGTPAVGNLLTPGVGSDAAGYWAVTTTAADAWLVVELVDTTRGEVEARFVF